jgi:hypothetical protein
LSVPASNASMATLASFSLFGRQVAKIGAGDCHT